MAVELILTPETEDDLASAYNWYESQRAGLGEEFMSCIDACLASILRHPQSFPVVHATYQRAVVRRFPYVVFFEFERGTVTIYSVFHTSKNPEKWRHRLC